MNGIFKRIGLVLSLALLAGALVACGNKGELYLEPIDLSEEQRELLNEFEGNKLKAKKKNSDANNVSKSSDTTE